MTSIIPFILLLIELNSGSFGSPVENSGLQLESVSSSSTKLGNVVVCDFAANEKLEYVANRPCKTESFSFSFIAYVHNKNLLKTSSLKHLAQTLSENTICDIKYMKYNNETQSLAYFQPGDSSYWYQGRQYNLTQQPEVLILSETSSKSVDKKKIIIKCPLPPSDVWLSLNRGDPKSIKPAQSHPLVNYRVTVSALHIKLAFLQVQGLNIKLKKTKTKQFEEMDDFSQNFINKNLLKNNKAPERYIVVYDSKCRQCQVNSEYSDFDPFRVASINCSLKPKTCEYDGTCYQDREIYNPLDYSRDLNGKPTINMFVCNTEFSQTELYMPCAVQNGQCGTGHQCVFNSSSLQMKCI